MAKAQTQVQEPDYRAQLDQARQDLRDMGTLPALVLSVSINRASGAVTLANNIDAAQIEADVERSINALDSLLREFRREQLRLAEERGKTGSNGRQADNGHKPDKTG